MSNFLYMLYIPIMIARNTSPIDLGLVGTLHISSYSGNQVHQYYYGTIVGSVLAIYSIGKYLFSHNIASILFCLVYNQP